MSRCRPGVRLKSPLRSDQPWPAIVICKRGFETKHCLEIQAQMVPNVDCRKWNYGKQAHGTFDNLSLSVAWPCGISWAMFFLSNESGEANLWGDTPTVISCYKVVPYSQIIFLWCFPCDVYTRWCPIVSWVGLQTIVTSSIYLPNQP